MTVIHRERPVMTWICT